MQPSCVSLDSVWLLAFCARGRERELPQCLYVCANQSVSQPTSQPAIQSYSGECCIYRTLQWTISTLFSIHFYIILLSFLFRFLFFLHHRTNIRQTLLLFLSQHFVILISELTSNCMENICVWKIDKMQQTKTETTEKTHKVRERERERGRSTWIYKNICICGQNKSNE